MKIRVAIYARTSPDCPLSGDDQVERLKTVAAERGWTVVTIFTDRPTSARGLDRRPGEVALIDAVRNGTVDRVLIWSVCRIGKSLSDLVSFMEMCRTAGVSVFMLEQTIDTEAPNAMSILDLTAIMALHLRQSRRDRILRGQAAARSLSIRFGRPPIPTAKIEKAKHFLSMGKGSSRGGEVGRWHKPVIRVANRRVPALNGHRLNGQRNLAAHPAEVGFPRCGYESRSVLRRATKTFASSLRLYRGSTPI